MKTLHVSRNGIPNRKELEELIDNVDDNYKGYAKECLLRISRTIIDMISVKEFTFLPPNYLPEKIKLIIE